MLRAPSSPSTRLALAIVTVLTLVLGGDRLARAVDRNTPLDQLRHESWLPRDGLPSDVVKVVHQTRDGYLWIGTHEGLVRFDGVQFTRFDRSRLPTLRDADVSAMWEAPDGTLWLGSDGGGLMSLRNGHLTAVDEPMSVLHPFVRAIAGTRDGSIWVATAVGVNRLRDGRFTRFTEDAGLPRQSVYALAVDHQDRLWVGTTGGLAVHEGDRFRPVEHGPLAPGVLVRALAVGRDGALWVGLHGQGLLRRDDLGWRVFGPEHDLPSGPITALHVGRDGTVWVGTLGGGLARFDGERFTTFSRAQGLSSDKVLAVFEDREGGLWIGTGDGGLDRLSDRPFRTYTQKDGLPGPLTGAVTQASDDSLWITVRGHGLVRWQAGAFQRVDTDALGETDLVSIAAAPDGGLWALTAKDQLAHWAAGRWRTWEVPGRQDPRMVFVDGGGRVWVAAKQPLRLEGDRLVNGPRSPEFSSLRHIHQGPSGALWIGLHSGIARLEGDQFIAYPGHRREQSGDVLALYEDRDRVLWAGTYRHGLKRWQNGELTGVSSYDGLPGDRIFQVLEDDDGRLWMSSSRGIFWVWKQQLTDAALGRRKGVIPVTYDARDGIAVGPGPRGLPAGCKARDGRLWFPTGRGLVVFDPKRLREHPPPPPVVLEEVRIDGRVLPVDAPAELPPTPGNLEVRYTALSLAAPTKTRFRYRLEGVDPDWVDAEGRRIAYYGKLAPGGYQFVVTAAGPDGSWNETGARFRFRLTAPFHRTVWFYALVALALGATALAGVRLRLRQERARATAVLAERTRIAREMHDTLAQSFVALSVQVEVVKDSLKRSPEQAAQQVERTRTLVRESLAEARRAVWALRPQSLEAGDLGQALSNVAAQLSPAGAIAVRVTGPARALSPRVEENLLRIGQEAMTNAVRHAEARRIDVHLAFSPVGVRLSVTDDGRGLPEGRERAADGKGQGLRGIRERAAAIGGTSIVRSGPGGTEVTVEVPT